VNEKSCVEQEVFANVATNETLNVIYTVILQWKV